MDDWAADWVNSPSPEEAFGAAFGEPAVYDDYTGEFIDG